MNIVLILPGRAEVERSINSGGVEKEVYENMFMTSS